MSSKDAHLYSLGPKKSKAHSLDTSASLAFTSHLSSLISTSSSSRSSARPSTGRPHKKKDDIFATHNRNTAKRAKRDVEDRDAVRAGLVREPRGEVGTVDDAAWARSKRKMEEKARLYAAMKRGDVEDEEGKLMVDFDSKWAAEQGDVGREGRFDNESSEGSEGEDEEVVEWEDEFGRTRKGTRRDRVREETRRRIVGELEERKRPKAPEKVIYGDTVQAAAFNPEREVVEKMETLAAKRDRSLTPPPDVHFDATREVRSKGVGFMQLSLDKEERKRQMEALEREREETESKRQERDKMMDERRAKLEERKRLIQEKRGKRKADEFLDGLEKEMAAQQDSDPT
ncbi:hypothetical protein CAC42_7186 [Sphaceloma murrayae]|uniref:Uncharacterized protein n=1 Tax=Sphaceloma murrayae TaxID=2082308 RepID=A0A2K1QQ27_9PEZI|nr:hypothetical protein CAC42_7186 [Sphaceloma murrayae]